MFAVNAVVDYRGPSDTDFFKKYDRGLLGVCEYFDRSYSYDFHDLHSSMYPKGDAIVNVLNYVPAYTGAKAHASERIP